MKKRRVMGALLAGIMAMALSVPASAVDITIDGSAASYDAFRLLNLTTSLKSEDDVVHESHEAGQHTDACYNYAYTVNDKYLAVMQEAMPDGVGDTDADGTVSGSEIITYLSTLTSNSADIQGYADRLYAAIKSDSISADATASDKTFSGVAQGYYLIAETSLSGSDDSRSLVMLDTAGQTDIEVDSKEGVPYLTKKVMEVNDSGNTAGGLQDAADMDVGDAVQFSLTSNFPVNIDAYDTYRYVIHDNLSANFRLDASSVTVTMQGQRLEAGVDYTLATDSLADDCDMEIQFTDIKTVAEKYRISLSDATAVNVTYSAELLESADLGNPGNENVAHLEFSNDPYDADSVGTTPSDKVVVFTYSLTVNKVNASDDPLPGAEFKLQKWNGTDYVDYEVEAGLAGADKTQFVFFGMDSGRYKLVEVNSPAGYNKAADIEFIVTGAYPAESDDAALTGMTVTDLEGEPLSGFSIDAGAGTLTIAIQNTTGIQLPSTGGIGLYIMMGVCAVAVVAGVILVLAPKKRED